MDINETLKAQKEKVQQEFDQLAKQQTQLQQTLNQVASRLIQLQGKFQQLEELDKELHQEKD